MTDLLAGIEILYEDNHLLLIAKPSGILSQADDSRRPDVLSVVKTYIKVRGQKPGQVFLGLLHRLDYETSGLMLLAKTSKAASRLSEEIRSRRFKKYYLCLTESSSALASRGRLEDYLLKDRRSNQVCIAKRDTAGAKYASLCYHRLARSRVGDLYLLELETGRSHQIRVQFAARGAALIGDRRYGSSSPQRSDQLALHAVALRFQHPVRREPCEFVSLSSAPAVFDACDPSVLSSERLLHETNSISRC
ncbi:MAG: RluA family pseudouridine synthase [Eubacteriales bacterium]|nr:RluA family pseudouridine synthase [Eubacteriales bacterium]